MDTNTNVRSLAARFNSAPSTMESPVKSPEAPALKGIQAKMAGFEKFSNSPPGGTGPSGIIPKKPPLTKPGFKPVTEDTKTPFSKPSVGVNRTLGSFHNGNNEAGAKAPYSRPAGFRTFDQQKEEPKGPTPRPLGNKPSLGASSPQGSKAEGFRPSPQPQHKENNEKPAFPKPSALKNFNMASESDSKPQFPKKPLATRSSGTSVPTSFENNKNAFVPKNSTPQENKPLKQTKDPPETSEPPSSVSQPFPGVALRSTAPKPIQSPFLKQAKEEPTGGPKPNISAKEFFKANQNGSSVPTVTKFPKVQTTFTASSLDKLKEQKDPSSEPKRRPLPPLFKLGPPPQKPTRPPNVNLEQFKSPKWAGGNKASHSEHRTSALSSALPPPPPSQISPGAPLPPPPLSSLSNKEPVSSPSVPNLPPRNIPIPRDDENYDDVEGPSIAEEESLESDGELYEGIPGESEAFVRQQELKNEKEEKKKLEQQRKEQKEREKKEQEIRKKFKLTGPIEAIHQVKACTDYKGGKNELSIKEGDPIEIIRVTNNPEGKWLGRMNGCYGYIKTTMVNIDYDSLKRKKSTMHVPKPFKQEVNDQEIYDDVEDNNSTKSSGGSGSAHFPPPPDDIYDGVDEGINDGSLPQDEDKINAWKWGILKKLKTPDFKKKSVYKTSAKEESEENDFVMVPEPTQAFSPDSDVYDDVGESDFPPPPSESSLMAHLKISSLGRTTEKDKTLKKLEKEEKEFRKKFKFTDEIKVLSTVHVATTLTTKKFGSKDLHIKPGESLEVIQHTNETQILCRSKEGKYGYVLRSNLPDMDGEIYDDIGEDCVYDND
ncbi:FYN-binding protein 1 isoform X2 [Xenopus laevis]|uniref:FYN-binding protein 1 n=1 Tax=Xenopus laevis TaxID=8355 RepID=A0A8J1M496_XENLA|nr:FYN-binding protein 1 isoform X2 [Xenopus laevis]